MAGTYSRVKTWASGNTLDASDLNAEFDNILNNSDPDGIDDASTNATAMQATADPYPAASESLATDLRGEVQRLRYVIKQITGETNWYVDPDTSIATLNGMLSYGTIYIPAGSCIPTTTNGAELGVTELATNDVMKEYYSFDDGTEEFVAVDFPMPEDWNLGTVKAKFFWSGASGCSAADTVEWQIAGQAISNDDAMDAALGDAGEVISDVVLAGTSGDLHISDATPAVTVGGTPALGDLIQWKFSRNVGGTDDMTEDALLFGVLIQYAKTIGAISAW